jgi:hypothetical protein
MELSKEQQILIADLKDDIEFYKEDLGTHIKSSKLYIILGISAAIIVGVTLVAFPQIIIKLQVVSSSMGMMTGIVGEVLPVTFASKFFNSSKVYSKKLKGLRVFEKTLKRMETGIVPNSIEDIMELESSLALYINT